MDRLFEHFQWILPPKLLRIALVSEFGLKGLTWKEGERERAEELESQSVDSS